MWTGLTLSHAAPRRPAAYGASSALTTTPSCPAATAASNAACAASASSAITRRIRCASGHDALERRAALGQRRVEQVLAVDVQDVEEQRGERDAAALARAEARGGDLEGLRPPVVAQRDRLAVEHDRAGRQRAGELDHLRQPRGDVVERARVDRDVVTVAVDLDPRAVELPVDRRRRDLLQRGGDVRGGAGEHRRERAHDLERDRVETGAAVGERDRRHRGEVAVQHQRAAQRRSPGRPPPSRRPPPSPRRARPGAGRRRAAGSGTRARPRSPARAGRARRRAARRPSPARSARRSR